MKRFLVTGGTGSVGQALVRSLVDSGAELVRVFSRDESKQFEMERGGFAAESRRLETGSQLVGGGPVRFLIGDVRDKDRLKRAFDGIECVFHAAAMKHVPACEYNPFEAVLTNVLGVQNVVEAALACGVKTVVSISTDKATHPDNTMGATKLLGEKLIVAGNYQKGSGGTRFCAVRFGNVLGSRGSIVPLFAKQIAAGGPVTVTDPDMARYVMTMDDAVSLLLHAAGHCLGGEVFVKRMPVVRIGDVAALMVDHLAPRHGFRPSEIEIRTIGLRPGETMDEDLITDAEADRAFMDEGGMIVIYPSVAYHDLDCCGVNARAFTTRDERCLSLEETAALLHSSGAI